jgi:hypothetical protein
MGQRGGTPKVTTDHEFIRDWVERRGGCPTALRRSGRARAATLQVEFPGRLRTEQLLSPISWDEFFDRFEQHKLAFVYQDTARGRLTSKLIDRASVIGVGPALSISELRPDRPSRPRRRARSPRKGRP